MGLTRVLGGLPTALAEAATARPHVLLVEMPGGRGVRRAVEDVLDARGWAQAPGPGTADALVLAGSPSEALTPYVDRVHAQLPGPRARLAVTDVGDVERALDHVVAHLGSSASQQRDVATRPDPRWVHRAVDEPAEPGHMAPHGIPLAEGAADRDDLEMDVLDVPLGPVLAHWPAGLVLHTELHGDVVADARVTWLGHEGRPATDLERTARVLDAAAGVLALGGDARRASRVRARRRRLVADQVGTRAQVRSDLGRLEAALRSRPVALALGRPALVLARQLADLLAVHAGSVHADSASAGGPALSAGELRAAVLGRDVGEVRLLVAALSPRLWLDDAGDSREPGEPGEPGAVRAEGGEPT